MDVMKTGFGDVDWIQMAQHEFKSEVSNDVELLDSKPRL
jgi:hypothetical protein